MSPEIHENEQWVARVRKLESEIRWMKRIGIAAIIIFAVLILLFRRVGYRQVSAEEFVLRDAVGRARARLAFLPEGPGLEINAASEEARVRLIGGGEEAMLDLYIPVTTARGTAAVNFFHNNSVVSSFQVGPEATVLDMRSAADGGTAQVSLQGGTTSLSLSSVGEKAQRVTLAADAGRACAELGGATEPSAAGSLCLHAPGLPALELVDLAGNRAVLGVTQTAPRARGTPQGTSAASLVLETKGGKSLHLTPR